MNRTEQAEIVHNQVVLNLIQDRMVVATWMRLLRSINPFNYVKLMPRNDVKAFTLAEVLITLGIIGIVAEMTIPTLMHNVQDQEFKVSWKKGFSTLSQASLMIMNDNAGSLEGVFTSGDQMKDVYKPYLSFYKDCNASDNCVYSYKYLNGLVENAPTKTSLFLNDGSLLEFSINDTECATIEGSSGISSCGDITLDVNGSKKPNIVGKDIFILLVQKNRVLPAGGPGFAGNYVGCDNTVYGWGCSYLYLYK